MRTNTGLPPDLLRVWTVPMVRHPPLPFPLLQSYCLPTSSQKRCLSLYPFPLYLARTNLLEQGMAHVLNKQRG